MHAVQSADMLQTALKHMQSNMNYVRNNMLCLLRAFQCLISQLIP